jgi:hypothetical protein
VYSGWIGSPESVVNDAGRSGVAAYPSAHASRASLRSASDVDGNSSSLVRGIPIV